VCKSQPIISMSRLLLAREFLAFFQSQSTLPVEEPTTLCHQTCFLSLRFLFFRDTSRRVTEQLCATLLFPEGEQRE